MDSTSALLICKKLTGDISAAEQQQLNELLEGDAVLSQQLQQLEAFWHTTPAATPASEADVQKILQRINETADREIESEVAAQPARVVKRSWWRYAAAAAVLVALAGAYYAWIDTQPARQEVAAVAPAKGQNIVTKPAYRTHVELHDGTKVWLNADSRLTYGNDFNKKQRVVYLIGEAFFDVRSNAAKPFVIHTSKLTVNVTGTSLNVRAYPGENTSEASLLEGRMEVRLQDMPEKVYVLQPSQKLVFSHDAAAAGTIAVQDTKKTQAPIRQQLLPVILPITYDPVDSLPFETAWVYHTLAFNNETFKQVALKMEKWFDVNIEFTNPVLENIRFTGRFEDETLDEALLALQIIGKFKFEIKDEKVIISP